GLTFKPFPAGLPSKIPKKQSPLTLLFIVRS
ncbi:MAG: hypothetical protein ACJAUL_002492, partial [Paraglaciecola sp.]